MRERERGGDPGVDRVPSVRIYVDIDRDHFRYRSTASSCYLYVFALRFRSSCLRILTENPQVYPPSRYSLTRK